MLFTIFQLDDESDYIVQGALGRLFGDDKVKFLGSVDGLKYSRLLYRVEKDSFYSHDDFKPFLEKYSHRFQGVFGKALKARLSENDYNLTVRHGRFNRVRVEYFPSHIYCFECEFKKTVKSLFQIPEQYRTNIGKEKLLREFFDVEMMKTTKKDERIVYAFSISSDLTQEAMMEKIEKSAFDVERRYRWDFWCSCFKSSFVKVVLKDIKPWRLTEHR